MYAFGCPFLVLLITVKAFPPPGGLHLGDGVRQAIEQDGSNLGCVSDVLWRGKAWQADLKNVVQDMVFKVVERCSEE